MPKIILSEYLSDSQLAEECGVTVRTVKRWRANRTGPATTYVGKTPYTRIQTAKNWLLKSEQKQLREAA